MAYNCNLWMQMQAGDNERKVGYQALPPGTVDRAAARARKIRWTAMSDYHSLGSLRAL